MIIVFLNTTINVRLGQCSPNCCFQKNNNYNIAYRSTIQYYQLMIQYRFTILQTRGSRLYLSGLAEPSLVCAALLCRRGKEKNRTRFIPDLGQAAHNVWNTASNFPSKWFHLSFYNLTFMPTRQWWRYYETASAAMVFEGLLNYVDLPNHPRVI